MSRINAGFAFVAVAAAAIEASAAAVSLDPAPVVSVGLYKNGLAVVTRRVTPGADGVAFVDADARPAYGSFWVVSGKGVSVSSTKADVLREDLDLGFAEGWTEAYAGRKVEVAFRCEAGLEPILDAAWKQGSMKVLAGAAGATDRIYTVRGTAVKNAAERVAEQPRRQGYWYYSSLYYDDYDRPQPKSAKALNVRMDSGSVVTVPEAAVVSVCSEDGDMRGLARDMPVWRFDGAKAPFDVQYLASGACWTPSYRLDLADGKGTVSMAAEVYNNIADWQDAEVSLISGFPNLLYADVPSLLGGGVDFGAYSAAIRNAEDDTYWGWFRRGGRDRGGVMSQSVMSNHIAPGGSSSFTVGAAESAGAGADVHYRGVGRMTLAKGDRRMLPLGCREVELKRIVEWNLSDDRDEGGNPRNGSEEERRTAWDAVTFANPFGFPMTTAPVEISEGGRVLGQSKIGWTNPGEATSVKITKALTVSVKYTESAAGMDGVKRWGGRDWRKESVKGTFRMVNHRGEPTTVRVKKTISGEVVDATDAKVHDRAAQPEKPNLEHDLTWEFVLAPGEDKVFSVEYWHWLWR